MDFSDCFDDGGGSGGGGGGFTGGSPGGNPGGGNPGGGGGLPGGGVGSDPTPWRPIHPIKTTPIKYIPTGQMNVSLLLFNLQNIEQNADLYQWWQDNAETEEWQEIYDYVYDGGNKTVAKNYIELLIELEEDPTFLIDIDCNELNDWSNLVMHQVPSSSYTKIAAMIANNQLSNLNGTYAIQYITGAKGPVVNLDYFSITINSLPAKPNSMFLYTPQEYLEYIRLNLNDFIDTQYSHFSPSTITGIDESQIWNSTNPLNAVLHINIPTAGDGSVMCTKYANNTWIFTTLEVPWAAPQGYDGVHPVSGHREFGLKQNPNGTYTFYTRGTDRITTFLDDLFGSSGIMGDPFQNPDALWNSLLDGVENHVNNNAGQAGTKNITISRPEWNDVKDVLLGNKPKSTLGCK